MLQKRADQFELAPAKTFAPLLGGESGPHALRSFRGRLR